MADPTPRTTIAAAALAAAKRPPEPPDDAAPTSPDVLSWLRYLAEEARGGGPVTDADFRLMSACSPPMVRALIDEIERL